MEDDKKTPVQLSGTKQVELRKLDKEEHIEEEKLKIESKKLDNQAKEIDKAAEDAKRDDAVRLSRLRYGTVVVLASLALLGGSLYWNRGFVFDAFGIKASTVTTTTTLPDGATVTTTNGTSTTTDGTTTTISGGAPIDVLVVPLSVPATSETLPVLPESSEPSPHETGP